MSRLPLLLCFVLAGCPAPSVGPDTGSPVDAPLPRDVPASDTPVNDAPIATDAPPDTSDAGDCIASEICGNGIDDDCNGTADDDVDADGDGWTACGGDCCDSADDCDEPLLVNPGAYDFVGDGVDDDCSSAADDPAAACDTGIASDEDDGMRYGAALGLCATTTVGGAERRWGLIDASFALASGSGTPAAESRSVRPEFGAIVPREGAAMTVLSSGNAAAPAQVRPFHRSFDAGTSFGTESSVPASWLDAHGGTIPAPPSCPSPTDETAYDSISLRMRIRVPTNARALALDTFFLASEFPEWVCSAYNDYAVVLLTSTATTNPTDGNLAQSFGPSGAVPLGTGAAANDSGLFAECLDGPTGCADGSITAGTISTCTGTALLAGTGFDLAAPGACDAGSVLGGGTGWLTVQGNVVPGETIELVLAIWDSSDARLDSVVIFDALRWLPDPVTAGMTR